jgi:hypothetical protein
VCFCGGPRRFAECCKQLVDQDASQENARANNSDASDLAAGEKNARAAVARYVIWVRRHTTFTINTAKGLYSELAEIDLLALEGLLRRLAEAQKAAGADESFISQLHHLADTIGIPKISVRLVALASEWFFRSGRSEEGILELDRLGDLGKVDDTLALMMAAKCCDLDSSARERMIRRASSSALCKEEKWTAQFALARRLFERNAKEEALTIVDAIISEIGMAQEHVWALSEAGLLRWRITKVESHFEFAMAALRQDPNGGRHASDLIDEGKYDEAEGLLASSLKDGDLIPKLLIIDARLRSGRRNEARDLLLTIDQQVPAHLLYPYGVAAALVALCMRDKELRSRALAALRRFASADT